MKHTRAESTSNVSPGRRLLTLLALLGIITGTLTGVPQKAIAAEIGTIGGRVLGGASEVPLAGLTVTLRSQEPDSPSLYSTTDSAGNYYFDRVAPSSMPYDMHVAGTPDGHYLDTRLGPINSFAGEAQTIDLRLVEAGRVSGSVITPDGAPASGASVWIGGSSGGNVTTDLEGRFLSGWTGPGSTFVRATIPGLAPSATSTVSVTSGNTTSGVSLSLREPVSVSGRVTAPSGSPVEAVKVSLSSSRSVVTDSDGRYTFPDVVEGSHSIQFEDPEGRFITEWWQNASNWSSATPVIVSLAKPSITGIDAQLSPVPPVPSDSIAGFVRDRHGVPLPGISLTAVGPSGSRYATTDYRGAYRFTNLLPGAYRVAYSSGTAAPYVASSVQVGVVSGTNELDIELQKKATVKVAVNADLPLGKASALTSVRLENIDVLSDVRMTARSLTSVYQDVTLSFVPPGRYRVHLVPLQDSWTFPEEWWDNAYDVADAAIITVEAEGEVSLDMTLDQFKMISTATPKIEGSPTVGSTLEAKTGAWTPTTAKLTYQWLRNGTPITGATSGTYVLADADSGNEVSVRVTGKQPGYKTAVRTSGTVTPSSILTGTPIPMIRGDAVVGRVLSVVAGSWGPAPVALSYQWKRGGVPITGATGTSYTLGDADAGRTITVTVTGKKDGYRSVQQTSVKTGAILRTIGLVAAPKVNGNPVVGTLITASAGSWAPTPGRVSYQWLRNGEPIPGATSDRYTPVLADGGKTLAIRVTVSATGYLTRTYDRAAANPVLQRFSSVATPAILGTPTVGNTLAVSTVSWGPAPVPLTFQWKRDGAVVTGAQGTSYRLTAADTGKRITVQVTGVKAGFLSESRTSGATTIVTPARVAGG